jgi:hypothetical protein
LALGSAGGVSPTILRVKGFRFYFFSREERRRKFWIEPVVESAANFSLKGKSWKFRN